MASVLVTLTGVALIFFTLHDIFDTLRHAVARERKGLLSQGFSWILWRQAHRGDERCGTAATNVSSFRRPCYTLSFVGEGQPVGSAQRRSVCMPTYYAALSTTSRPLSDLAISSHEAPTDEVLATYARAKLHNPAAYVGSPHPKLLRGRTSRK